MQLFVWQWGRVGGGAELQYTHRNWTAAFSKLYVQISVCCHTEQKCDHVLEYCPALRKGQNAEAV